MRFRRCILLCSACAALLLPVSLVGEEAVELPPVSFPVLPPYVPAATETHEKELDPLRASPRLAEPQRTKAPAPSQAPPAGTGLHPPAPTIDGHALPLVPFGDLYAPPREKLGR